MKLNFNNYNLLLSITHKIYNKIYGILYFRPIILILHFHDIMIQ